MPRHPQVAPATQAMRGSLFTQLADRIQRIEGERHPLHVGDTWLQPPVHMEDLRAADHPNLHRYTVPHGLPELVAALADRRSVTPDRILVTAGATGGLNSVAGGLLSAGDEVLILAPFWPLIRGIVHTARGRPVQVPFFDRMDREAPDLDAEITRLLEPHLSSRTAALYVNTPNNPTGRVLTEGELGALVRFARRHDLWIWSDEVYEHHAFARPHVRIGELAPERTFSACSFSKAYGMAGNRCGYLVGPEGSEGMAAATKISTHTVYSTPTAGQVAALEALRHGDEWLAQSREHYQRAGNRAAEALGLAAPEGGTFLFLDVAEALDDRGLKGFLEDCIDQGLVLAPGSSCGEAYGSFVRVCYTSAPPDVVARGVAKLVDLLGTRS